MASTTTTDAIRETQNDAARARGSAVDSAREVAGSVTDAAAEVGARVPDVAQSTRDVMTEATRAIQRGSDGTLRLAGAALVGFSVGLLTGGASRPLVLAALVPAGLIGVTLLDRAERGAPTPRAVQGR